MPACLLCLQMQTALLMQLCGDLNTSINSLEGAKGDAGKL